jgi:hypothetical protein
MRVGAVEVAGDLASHGRVDVESIQFVRGRPTHVVGFAVGCRESPRWPAEQGHLVLLADLPVGVGNDVGRVGEDPDKAGDCNIDPGLLLGSRMAHSAMVSPSSCLPIGRAHWPVSRRRWRRISPRSFTASTPEAGTRLFGAGASGSCQYSIRPTAIKPSRRARAGLFPRHARSSSSNGGRACRRRADADGTQDSGWPVRPRRGG